MKQQRLIELIRSASLKQALEFVQVSASYTPLTRLSFDVPGWPALSCVSLSRRSSW